MENMRALWTATAIRRAAPPERRSGGERGECAGSGGHETLRWGGVRMATTKLLRTTAHAAWRSSLTAIATPALAGSLAFVAVCAVAVVSTSAQAQSNVASNAPSLDQQLRQRLGQGSLTETASLEADRIDFDPATEVVTASGDVRVFYADRVLRADRITYDGKRDRIQAFGDIRLINPDGSVVAADNAVFDSELQNGLIQGARAVMADGRARFAAVEGRRIDGRFTTLSKAVFSPCAVCEDNPTPLWRIRARRIVQDEQARDITYEDATFEVLGVPVAYLPFFRHADPSVKRRSGFLTPSYLHTDALGDAGKLPYFWAISPNRDLTVTPFVATEENPILELEYRAWEGFGKFTLGGSATHSDDSLENGFRGHLYGDGLFDLGDDIVAGYEILLASDDTYLRRYDYTSTDRTTSRIFVEKFGEQGFAAAEGVYFQSYRADEFTGSIPLVLPNIDVEQSWDAGFLGGDFTIGANALALSRDVGRDVNRLSGEARWDRRMTTSAGLVFDVAASVRGDAYYVSDDPAFDEEFVGRVLPLAKLEVSYPLGLSTATADHIVSPIASAVYTPYGGNPVEIPSEDSIDAELDELGIFSENRFPGLDRWEEGPRLTAGVRYQRLARDGGVNIDATLGQSYRLRESTEFSSFSGLRDASSDIVGSWQLSFDDPGFGEDLTLGHRFRTTDRLNFQRNEAYASADLFDNFRMKGTYVFLNADPSVSADDDRSEINGELELDITDFWTVSGGARRDIENTRFVDARGGLRYSDECLELNFGVSRRFNSVEDAPQSTNFGFSVRLKALADD